MAERVAEERCEPIGQTVGYQVRLEQEKSGQWLEPSLRGDVDGVVILYSVAQVGCLTVIPTSAHLPRHWLLAMSS